MFDFGSGELLVIGVVALVVIGPKELPGLLRTVGQTVARLRRMAGDFQGQFHDALREAELHDAVTSLSDLQSSVLSATDISEPKFNPQQAIATVPVDPAAANIASVDQPAVPTSEPVSEEKPKRTRAKKPKPAEPVSTVAEPQAALFDTLDARPSHGAEAVNNSAPEPAPKKPRTRKPKPKTDEASE